MNYNRFSKTVRASLPRPLIDTRTGHPYADPQWEDYQREGWHEYEPAAVAEGMRVVGQAVEIGEDGVARQVVELEPIPPPPEPVPARFEAGIDAPILVLDAGEKGIGYVAADDGSLVPVVYAHESPYDMDALRARIEAARKTHTERKAERKAERKVAVGAMGKGQLQARIEALEAWVMAMEGGN
jgi:hypothetical protein